MKVDINDRNVFSYEAYNKHIQDLFDQGKTTGPTQSDDMLRYTKMNLTRIRRWDKTAELTDELKESLDAAIPQEWIVLTEAWCGDASQNIPFIHKMAEEAGIKLSLLLRDENLDLMDQFLTNGGRAIPKLIALDMDKNLLFDWGPRPKSIQEIYHKNRESGMPYADNSKIVHGFYAKNKGEELMSEFVELLKVKKPSTAL